MATIFALGSNGSGQLGIGHKEDVSVPKQVLGEIELEPSPVSKVAAGGNHTLVLAESGDLFWSGDGSTGACGRIESGHPAAATEFRKVALPSVEGEAGGGSPFHVGQIAATWEASIITRRDENGKDTKVYSSGVGLKGELGLGELIVRTPSFSEIPDFPPSGLHVVELAACMGHVVAVLSNGDAYGWGNGRKGQLGTAAEIVSKPQKIDGVSFKVAKSVCGREFTCLFGEPSKGEVAILGSDKWDVRSSAPATVANWRQVGASWGTVFVLGQDGKLVSWGRNDHGQQPPDSLPQLSHMAIGSEHALGLSKEGDVLAWGWGEHGNCGPQVDKGDVKGRWNTIASSKYIPSDAFIASIGAGCATSWVTIAARPQEGP